MFHFSNQGGGKIANGNADEQVDEGHYNVGHVTG